MNKNIFEYLRLITPILLVILNFIAFSVNKEISHIDEKMTALKADFGTLKNDMKELQTTLYDHLTLYQAHVGEMGEFKQNTLQFLRYTLPQSIK